MWGKGFLNEDGVDNEDVGIGVVKTLEKGEELVQNNFRDTGELFKGPTHHACGIEFLVMAQVVVSINSRKGVEN